MFEIGEVVFRSLRGIGVVEAIEERTMLGESREYVIIQMKEPSLTMMVPRERIATSGFRKISDKQDADQVEDILAKKEVDVNYSIDMKRRAKQNQEKLSTGSLVSCSEVVRDLSCMNTIKALNNAEKTTLIQAKKLLIDELSIIKNISAKEAESMVNGLLGE